MVVVEQFCSWSAWRMNSTSIARARTGSALVVRLGDLPHHREEVLGEAQVVVRVDEGHAHAETVRRGGEGRHLGDEPHDLAIAHPGVGDVLRLGIERRERCDRRDEHAHRVRVVVEALEESLAHVLVDEGVVGDLAHPLGELHGRRQLAVEQQVGDLEVGRALGQLLDRVAAVLQDPGVAVDVGDRALALGGRGEPGIVEPDPREQLRPGARVDGAVDDGDLDGLARSVVGDGDAVGHAGHLLARHDLGGFQGD